MYKFTEQRTSLIKKNTQEMIAIVIKRKCMKVKSESEVTQSCLTL